MANSIETRVRFAMWNTMRLAADLVGGDGKRIILAALKRDTDLFYLEGLREKRKKRAAGTKE